MNNGFLVLTICLLTFLFSCKKENSSEPPTEIPAIVTIGTQVWMTKNLDVDHYRNGDSIPEVRDRKVWEKLTTGAWCYYNNDSTTGKTYGKLYNWYAVMDQRGLTPVGWHVATDADWTKLVDFLGDWEVAGGKLKETGTNRWQSTTSKTTNESRFSAIPGGNRNQNGEFLNIQNYGYWWTSTGYDEPHSWFRKLSYNYNNIYRDYLYDEYGCSVRCVKNSN